MEGKLWARELILALLRAKWNFFLGWMEENRTLETQGFDFYWNKAFYNISSFHESPRKFLVTLQEFHFHQQQVGTQRVPCWQQHHMTSQCCGMVTAPSTLLSDEAMCSWSPGGVPCQKNGHTTVYAYCTGILEQLIPRFPPPFTSCFPGNHLLSHSNLWSLPLIFASLLLNRGNICTHVSTNSTV